MRPITLHPVSVLVGVALAGLAVVLVGAAQAPGAGRPIPTTEVRLVGNVPADWWTYVSLTPTQPFTVPPDRHFVVTLTQRYQVQLFVSGQHFDEALSPLEWPSASRSRTRASRFRRGPP